MLMAVAHLSRVLFILVLAHFAISTTTLTASYLEQADGFDSEMGIEKARFVRQATMTNLNSRKFEIIN